MVRHGIASIHREQQCVNTSATGADWINCASGKTKAISSLQQHAAFDFEATCRQLQPALTASKSW